MINITEFISLHPIYALFAGALLLMITEKAGGAMVRLFMRWYDSLSIKK